MSRYAVNINSYFNARVIYDQVDSEPNGLNAIFYEKWKMKNELTGEIYLLGISICLNSWLSTPKRKRRFFLVDWYS